jgi:hypothetical protein
MPTNRSHQRRRVYVNEAVDVAVSVRGRSFSSAVVDVSQDGLGLAVTSLPASLPAVGETVLVGEQPAVVRHVGRLRSGGRVLPRIGVELVVGEERCAGFFVPDGMPVFAAAASPWFHRERVTFRVDTLGAGGMTMVTREPLLAGTELTLELHLPLIGVETVRGRVASPGVVDWIEPSRAFLKALAGYLLAADGTLTPVALRSAGFAVGSVEHAVTYDHASVAEVDEILALRLTAHQAIGHLEDKTVEDMRASYDSHSRHLVCRFGDRIVGYVRVIFVDSSPARSQYVSLGGHDVPSWLWEAGFVEAGAGAMDPEFQKAGLFVPLMAHSTRVAVQSGHRFILGACDDDLLGMYAEMGYELLETRSVEPKPGWKFQSHLIYMDIEKVVAGGVSGRAVADMAAAARFAGFEPAALAAAA